MDKRKQHKLSYEIHSRDKTVHGKNNQYTEKRSTESQPRRTEIDIYAKKIYQIKQSYIQTMQQYYDFSNYLLHSNKYRFISTTGIFSFS